MSTSAKTKSMPQSIEDALCFLTACYVNRYVQMSPLLESSEATDNLCQH